MDKHHSEVKTKMDKHHSEVKAKMDKHHSEVKAKMEKHNSDVIAQLDVMLVHFSFNLEKNHNKFYFSMWKSLYKVFVSH
jgi:L-lactate utilization protein LutB